jgi:hypothetical protein
MATISENLEVLKTAKTNIKNAIEGKGQDLTNVPFTQYGEKIAEMQTSENLDTELNEQDTLLAELESSVGELQEKPYDMLQARVDATNSCKNMFYGYEGDNVDFIKGLDTSNVVNMQNMFIESKKITEIYLTNTSKVTKFWSAFKSCEKLKKISGLNTDSATDVFQMFGGCYVLTDIPPINLINVTDGYYTTGTFGNCRALSNLIVKNIKVSLQIGSGTSWGHLLTDNSIINTFQELWDLTGKTAQTLTLSTPSNARTSEIYVKLVDITDEMRAQDEYIDNKKPCVVCESTDEGSMTLKEYGISKNWNIA